MTEIVDRRTLTGGRVDWADRLIEALGQLLGIKGHRGEDRSLRQHRGLRLRGYLRCDR